MTTRPQTDVRGKHGPVRPTVEENRVEQELNPPSQALYPPHQLALLAVHILAVADVDCLSATSR